MPEYADYIARAEEALDSAKILFENKGYIEETYAKAFARDMQLRERADYDVSYRACEEEAESVIEDAERFMERVKIALETMRE